MKQQIANKSSQNAHQVSDPYQNEFADDLSQSLLGFNKNSDNPQSAHYFQHLFKGVPFGSLKKTYDDLNKVAFKMQSKVFDGQVKVNSQKDKVDKIIKINRQIEDKRRSLSTELKMFNIALDYENNSRFSHSKSENKINLKHRVNTELSYDQIIKVIEKRKFAEQRLKNWKKRIQQTKKIKQQSQLQRKIREQKIERQKAQEIQRQRDQKQKSKKQAIKQKLLQISQRKKQRQQILKRSKTQNIQRTPTYIIRQKKFKQEQIFKEHQRIQLRKLFRKKMEQQFDREHIKQHQKMYDELVKSRVSTKRAKTQTVEHSFSNSRLKIVGRSDAQIQQEKKKSERRTLFQSRLKQIKIKPSLSKMIESEIKKDKAANPFKYHFLEQKALDDLCIYSEFHDFVIPDFDRKALGNKYFNQIKQRLKTQGNSSRVSKVTKNINQSAQKYTNSLKYNNYLKDIKIRKPRKLSQIERIIKQSGSKSKVIQSLKAESTKHQNKVMKLIFELKKDHEYADAIKKQDEIDSEYIKSIKARVACLQLNQ